MNDKYHCHHRSPVSLPSRNPQEALVGLPACRVKVRHIDKPAVHIQHQENGQVIGQKT
jgi:hypothetical protein